METIFRFLVQYPLLPLAILIVSVLVGFLFLLRNKEFFSGEGGLAVAESENNAATEFKAPRFNTPLTYAIIELDRVGVQLRALNVGLATVHLANCFVHLQDVGEEEKIPINGRVQDLAVMVKKMAETSHSKYEELLQELQQGRTKGTS